MQDPTLAGPNPQSLCADQGLAPSSDTVTRDRHLPSEASERDTNTSRLTAHIQRSQNPLPHSRTHGQVVLQAVRSSEFSQSSEMGPSGNQRPGSMAPTPFLRPLSSTPSVHQAKPQSRPSPPGSGRAYLSKSAGLPAPLPQLLVVEPHLQRPISLSQGPIQSMTWQQLALEVLKQ